MFETRVSTFVAALMISPVQAQVKDLDGWSIIKWGMTVEQAKSVLGNDARLIDLEADEAELKALWTKYNLPKDIERHFVEALRVEGVQVGSLMMEASVMVRPEDKVPSGYRSM